MNGTILYYGGFALPNKNAAAHRVIANSKIFRDLGYKVVFLGTRVSKEYFNGVLASGPMQGFDVYEESHPHRNRQWLHQIYNTENILRILGLFPDTKIIILYNVPYIKVLQVRYLTKKLKIKLVYDCTEWCNFAEGSTVKKIIKKIDAWAIKNLLAVKVDGMIVISNLMLQKYKKVVKCILKLPPLVDIAEPIWHQKRIMHEGKTEFCFAGGLDGNKEYLHIIVEAFIDLRLPNVILRVIGVTKDNFTERYPALAEIVRDVGDRVLFMGRLPHEETVQYVLSADYYIFIRPRDQRNNAGFPTKFVEAYTCGVPILTTNVSDVARFIKSDDEGCVLSTTSVEDIRKGIMNIVKVFPEIGERDRAIRETFDYRQHIENCKTWFVYLSE